MKYKDIVARQLEILSNRLDNLVLALQNRKPMSTDELIRELQINKKTVDDVIDKVSLEDNDFARMGAR